MPSDSINTLPIKANLIYAQWISSGYINTVPRNMNPFAQWLSLCIHTSGITIHEIMKTHKPSGYLDTCTQWQY